MPGEQVAAAAARAQAGKAVMRVLNWGGGAPTLSSSTEPAGAMIARARAAYRNSNCCGAADETRLSVV